jgi:hypothetical protein
VTIFVTQTEVITFCYCLALIPITILIWLHEGKVARRNQQAYHDTIRPWPCPVHGWDLRCEDHDSSCLTHDGLECESPWCELSGRQFEHTRMLADYIWKLGTLNGNPHCKVHPYLNFCWGHDDDCPVRVGMYCWCGQPERIAEHEVVA